MMDRILLAGFGGQGVMFIGKMLAYAGMMDEREVCWIPSYGPEMRGGTANCSVIIADEEIHSPVIDFADAGIVLNQPSYDKFLNRIKPGGALVVNSSIINLTTKREDIVTIAIEAGAIANELGNPAMANMVCLGALLPKLTMADFISIKKALDSLVGKNKPELYDINLAAIQKGIGE
jgi:2-oxoglutarate ferredoxin oxidoreductase subunit gamma